MPAEKWNRRFNPAGTARSLPWINVLGAIVALAVGATALIASIAFVAQRAFEYEALMRAEAAPFTAAAGKRNA
ncbi:MAG: hypothetical protein ABIQ29_08085, partial [Burkholderiaceae bacterium]